MLVASRVVDCIMQLAQDVRGNEASALRTESTNTSGTALGAIERRELRAARSPSRA